MFKQITLRGGAATLLLGGYQPAAVLGAWSIRKVEGAWTLTARVATFNAFQIRQRPIIFTAPRKGGFWCWPVLSLTVETHSLTARLGPPEQ